MAKLYVYDSYENRMLVYNNLNENDQMPYSYGSTLSVREFRGSTHSTGEEEVTSPSLWWSTMPLRFACAKSSGAWPRSE